MYALLRKDLLLLRSKVLQFIYVLGIWLVISSTSIYTLLQLFPIFTSVMIVVTLLSESEKSRSNYMLCSLPLKRSTIVYARYLMDVSLIILGILGSYAVGLFCPNPLLTPAFALIILFLILSCFFILYPIYYLLGFSVVSHVKQVIIGSIIIIITIGLGVDFLIRNNINPFAIPNISLYCSLLLPFQAYFSIILSLRFFRRQEF